MRRGPGDEPLGRKGRLEREARRRTNADALRVCKQCGGSGIDQGTRTEQ